MKGPPPDTIEIKPADLTRINDGVEYLVYGPLVVTVIQLRERVEGLLVKKGLKPVTIITGKATPGGILNLVIRSSLDRKCQGPHGTLDVKPNAWVYVGGGKAS